jgi:hypothetical protein
MTGMTSQRLRQLNRLSVVIFVASMLVAIPAGIFADDEEGEPFNISYEEGEGSDCTFDYWACGATCCPANVGCSDQICEQACGQNYKKKSMVSCSSCTDGPTASMPQCESKVCKRRCKCEVPES